MKYSKYINSSKWKAKRKTHLAANPVCVRCGSSKFRHVHHLTYKNFGNEQPEDLVTLCRGCHEAAHDCRDKTHCPLELAHLLVDSPIPYVAPKAQSAKEKKSPKNRRSRRHTISVGKRRRAGVKAASTTRQFKERLDRILMSPLPIGVRELQKGLGKKQKARFRVFLRRKTALGLIAPAPGFAYIRLPK